MHTFPLTDSSCFPARIRKNENTIEVKNYFGYLERESNDLALKTARRVQTHRIDDTLQKHVNYLRESRLSLIFTHE